MMQSRLLDPPMVQQTRRLFSRLLLGLRHVVARRRVAVALRVAPVTRCPVARCPSDQTHQTHPCVCIQHSFLKGYM